MIMLSNQSTETCPSAPLHGERDEQREFGLASVSKAGTFDFSNSVPGTRPFFDNDVMGNRISFLTLTLQRARIRGWG